MKVPFPLLLVGAMGAGAAGVFVASEPGASTALRAFSGPMAGCQIKGNISINTGERIYHVPGQTYYNDTVVRAEHGERWFCSEADARAAGWRRSKV